ncbi:S41 family peptidase [Massilia suwonensis]|uniref:S41 family peptidase n=1 Tax=Massilia suwonensis TaxID=648895 RepID=A0ABW0MNC1_9BURK
MPSFPRFVSCLAGLAAGAAFAAGPTLPATPDSWRAAARGDIEAAVQVTRENHPGAHDPTNPSFLARIEDARRHGLALAARVEDAAGYVAAVEAFNARIGDGHAGMRVMIDEAALPPPRWPGFVSAWRGDALYVYASRPGEPPVGSKLLGCDGRPGEQLIRENVFAFGGRVEEAGQWWTEAPRLFVDTHNPFVALPQRCRFEGQGKAFEHTLAWRPFDAEARRWRQESESLDVHPVGMSEPRPKLVWVAMPTFHPNEAERSAYRAMTRDAAENRARWLALDAVVIDLRKNGGGNSAWSHDFARALWGRERVDRALADFSARSEVWWRASPANTDYVDLIVQVLARQGQPGQAAWAREQAAGMRAALARGEPYYVQKKDASASVAAAPDATPPFTRPVYVVVPGDCASSCLDALDAFTRFPNTTLIGAPSSADSTYMEVRRHPLASKLARVMVPNKMYVNRGRANGQFYPAAIEVRDLVWSSETLLETVERDLAQRRAHAQALSNTDR